MRAREPELQSVIKELEREISKLDVQNMNVQQELKKIEEEQKVVDSDITASEKKTKDVSSDIKNNIHHRGVTLQKTEEKLRKVRTYQAHDLTLVADCAIRTR